MIDRMALGAGSRVGSYEVIGLLGTGGMGEVYRARDTKLNRDVAIKVLPAAVAGDAERLARFSREAQVLASLNHPNIAHIHGFEDATGVRALVMELVEGRTLADRIAERPIPVDEALPLASQIAQALEAAHEQGIIHRDLKPANIKVTSDGTVKVLDFGLAKALDPVGAAAANASDSPTLSMQATAAGVILGTAAYMAPEQARGKAVDKRADIWAFGCVLYEMLTGQRAFRGDEVTDIIVAVVSKDPDWDALPREAAHARPLLVRCLKKDRRQRLQAIGDARILVEELISGSTDEHSRTLTPASSPIRGAPAALGAIAVGAMLAGLATWALTRPGPPPTVLPVRFEIVPATAHALTPGSDRDIAVSPDGRYIAYRGGAGGTELIVRAFDRLDAQALPNAANVRQPFFSPDSQWIGFFDGLTLKKVSIAGGAAIEICISPAIARGASWGDDNQIVFGTTDTNSGLWRVPAGGGEPVAMTTPDRGKGETNHWYPSPLPAGRGVLFTLTARDAAASARVVVLDSRTRQQKVLIRGSQAEYLQSGHLIYVADGTLHAVPFDLESLELTGDPVPVIDRVWTAGGGASNYGISRAGTLVYVPQGAPRQRSLVWVDRDGRETPLALPQRLYDEPRLSPDASRVAVAIRDQDYDIHLLDLATGGLRRLTFDPSIDASPVWTPDGRRIVFGSQRAATNVSNLFIQNADGTGTTERVSAGQHWQTAGFVTPDGISVVGFENPPKTSGDIVRFPLKSAASPPATGTADGGTFPVEPLIQTSFFESNPAISPDGRFIAYQSNESGQSEIYVRPFPRVDEGRWQVSSSGGTAPAWARDGRELFYLDPANRLTAVRVRGTATTFTFDSPAAVLQTTYAESLATASRAYDVSADGKRFLMIKENGAAVTSRTGMVVVLNWLDELKAKVSSR